MGIWETEHLRGKWMVRPRLEEREMVFKKERDAGGKQNE